MLSENRHSMTGHSTTLSGLRRFLPPIGSPAYHVMLACVAILILGPLGGISAAFMNFSIGFFGGGLIAGDALAALSVGIYGLLRTIL